MRSTSISLVLMAIAVSAYPIHASDESPQSAEPTRAAKVMRLTADPRSGLTTPLMIEGLLNGVDLRTYLARELFDSDGAADQIQGVVILLKAADGPALPPGVLVGLITVESHNEEIPADKIMEKLPAALNKILHGYDDAFHQQLDQRQNLEKQLAQDTEKLGQEHRKRMQLEKALGATSDPRHLSLTAATLGERTQAYARRRDEAELELTAMKLREESLQQRIAALGKELQASSTSSAAIQKGVAAVRIAKEKYEAAGRSGVFSAEEMRNLQAALQVAEAEFRQAGEAAMAPGRQTGEAALAPGRERLTALRTQLEELTPEITVAQMKFERFSEQAESARQEWEVSEEMMRRATEASSDIELIGFNIQTLEDRVRRRRAELDRLEDQQHMRQRPAALFID